MFIRPKSEAELDTFVPDFTIINACKVTNADYKVCLDYALIKNRKICAGTLWSSLDTLTLLCTFAHIQGPPQ